MALPAPKFNIGDTVLWLPCRNRTWNEKQYLRYLIADHRKTARQLHRDGYAGYEHRLSNHMKGLIRDCVKVLREATVVEIAGIVPFSMYNVDSAIFNQCYLASKQGVHSGVSYRYQLLIRFNVRLNQCAMITGIPVASEQDLRKE